MHTLDADDALRLPIASPHRMYGFDGTRPHETAPYSGHVESRISVIFFQNNRGWSAPKPVLDGLSEIGFEPAVSQEDAERFAGSFELLADGRSYASWPVSDTAGV